MKLRFTALILMTFATLAFVSVAPASATAPDENATTDRADPTAKTLPSHASDTAKANAFGAQGERMRAAHAAAKAAAVRAAARAARDAQATLPAQAVAGRANADAHRPDSPGAQGQIGLDVAAAHGAYGSPTSHPTPDSHPTGRP